MGYILKNIANITEPKQLSLSKLPNYVQFASLPANRVTLLITVYLGMVTEESQGLLIHTPSGTDYAFPATHDKAKAYGNVFYISELTVETAENVRQALLSNSWLADNFYITIPADWSGSTPVVGQKIYIESKGAGDMYNITVTSPGDPGGDAFVIEGVRPVSQANDSIVGEDSDTSIQVEVYTGNNIVFGRNDKPDTLERLGRMEATLRKTYAGAPVWFDLNALFGRATPHNLPPVSAIGAPDWFDAGTAIGYRVIAKTSGVNNSTFYYSNALWAIAGGSRISDAPDMEPYIYSGGQVKLLTNRPRVKHMRGMRQYLNFILKRENPDEFYTTSLLVCFRAYTAGGQFLGQIFDQNLSGAINGLVNTCVLRADEVLGEFPEAALLKINLAKGNLLVSDTMELQVVPEHLHTLNYVSFINMIGGWDTFNFDAVSLSEVKPTNTTYFSPVTPSHRRGDGVETVLSVALDTPLTVDSAPVPDAVAEWAKEIAASPVVLDMHGNYIIKDDFTVKIDPKTKNFQTITMKYHLSETYNNE